MAYDDQGLAMFYNKSTAEIVRMRAEAGKNGSLVGTVIYCSLLELVIAFLPIFGLLAFISLFRKSGNGPVVDRLNRNFSVFTILFSVFLIYYYFQNGIHAGFDMAQSLAIPALVVSLIVGFASIKGGNTYIQGIEKALMKEANANN
ncbi:hypothetical protein [Salinicola sp. MIT1003]|uniref:hypothetical protein n=1 Tax=Salinicola sp. MIT1003 TaxID=1882734 RepID=UPI0014807800|nr:hypothetical protein [Salinicola sp. MIT1003]